jgi:hypothetical protein
VSGRANGEAYVASSLYTGIGLILATRDANYVGTLYHVMFASVHSDTPWFRPAIPSEASPEPVETS